MNILIVTVAGSSTRFSKSVEKEVLKCIYYDKSVSESLIYKMLNQPVQFDKYIIVGGYKYEELKDFIEQYFSDYQEKIELVYNRHFATYGSGYSLYCGLIQALRYSFNEIVFAEGDLYVDSNTFLQVVNNSKCVITTTSEAIRANKAVAFYINCANKIRYIYDTGHTSLRIDEEFLAIFNSGQIWKFSNRNLLIDVYNSLGEEDWMGTNLVMVERYFEMLDENDYDIICFDKWINCNTVDDFLKMKEIENENN